MRRGAVGRVSAKRETRHLLAIGAIRFAIAPYGSDSIVKQPKLRRPPVVARGLRLGPFPLKKVRGMERWTALARLSDAPVARLAVEPVSGNGRRQPAIRGRRAFRRSIAAIALGSLSRLAADNREAGSRRRAAHFAEVRLFLAFNPAWGPGHGFCPIPEASVRNGEGPHIHVSQLLAGDRSVPGRSPDAARAPADEADAQAPRKR